MKAISVITQTLDFGTLRFLAGAAKRGLTVKYLLIAPSVSMHPLRERQSVIRAKVLGRTSRGDRRNAAVSAKYTVLGICKRVGYRLVLLIFKLAYGLRVERLGADFSSVDSGCFRYVTVLYSLEGLISAEALKRFPQGIINIHPAPLPNYRGLDGGLWALNDDAQLGVSAYVVDEGIDTGAIIEFYPLSDAGQSLEEYLRNLKCLKLSSYFDAIEKKLAGELRVPNPEIDKSQNRGVMSEEVLSNLRNGFPVH